MSRRNLSLTAVGFEGKGVGTHLPALNGEREVDGNFLSSLEACERFAAYFFREFEQTAFFTCGKPYPSLPLVAR